MRFERSPEEDKIWNESIQFCVSHGFELTDIMAWHISTLAVNMAYSIDPTNSIPTVEYLKLFEACPALSKKHLRVLDQVVNNRLSGEMPEEFTRVMSLLHGK